MGEHRQSPDELVRAWQRGRAALDSALDRLQEQQRADCETLVYVRRVLAEIERGELASALDLCHAAPSTVVSDEVGAKIAEAIGERNRVLEIAVRSHGTFLRGIARHYPGARDPEDGLARVWVKVTQKVYTWRSEGSFAAWLSMIARRALLDDAKSTRRLDVLFTEVEPEQVTAPTEDGGGGAIPGTMTAWLARAMRGYRDSLDPERRELWDGWERLGGDGMRPEEIYRELARANGGSISAIKMAIHRLEVEFRELIGADKRGHIDASRVVALWVGSERRGAERAVLVTGIDVDDQVRLLAAHQVPVVNARTFTRIFWALRRWGLPTTRRVLVVVDESEGLLDALASSFPGLHFIQRCIDGFIDSLTRDVSVDNAEVLRRRLRNAFASRSVAEARRRLSALAESLEASHPSSSQRLREEVDVLLTVKALELPEALEAQLTRVVFFASGERPGPLRWVGDAFRRIRLHRSIPRRKEALVALAERMAIDLR